MVGEHHRRERRRREAGKLDDADSLERLWQKPALP
jgi:hypothetical protein